MTAMLRHRWLVRSLVGLGVVAVVLVLLTATMADARPRSRAVVNQAVAIDTKAGHRTHRVAWMVRTNVGGALPSNLAKAQTWCNDCRTSAFAVQIVLMSGVTGPTASWNHSVAANSRCVRCATASGAFQFAVISNGQVALTPSGSAQLAGLRAELNAIAASDAAPAEMNAAAVGVAQRVLGVLQRELRTGASTGGAQGFRTLRADRAFQVQYHHETDTATN
jgi:hypothetical protein